MIPFRYLPIYRLPYAKFPHQDYFKLYFTDVTYTQPHSLYDSGFVIYIVRLAHPYDTLVAASRCVAVRHRILFRIVL